MRSVIAYIATSLDMFIAREKGEVDWLFPPNGYGYEKFIAGIDTVLMGRKTYELACTFEEIPYAGMKCIVFTRNAKKLKRFPHVQFISKDIQKFVRALKKEKGKNIWLVGGGEIITTLHAAKLVDEFMLFMHPLLLGKGIPLLKNASETKLKLLDTHAFPDGLVKMHYAVNKKYKDKSAPAGI
jgi:dihydrofolate reductase